MSWLGELVGKAEDFLNKVDQSAAVALHKDNLPVTSSSSFPSTINSIPETYKIPVMSKVENEKQGSHAIASATPKASPKAKKHKANDVDELLEYLNSSEPTLRNNKSSPTKNANVQPQSQQLQSQTAANVEELVLESPEDVNDSSVEDVSNDAALESGEQTMEVDSESRSLRQEAATLKQEVSHLMKLNKQLEIGIQKSKQKSEYSSSFTAHLEKQVKEVQERESDLKQALDAKDSQLAVLRVRLQEADQELSAKKTLLDSLQQERERLLQDHNDSSGLHSQTIQMLKEKLEENEGILQRERNHFKMIQDDTTSRLAKVEEEHKEMVIGLREAQQQAAAERSRATESSNHLKASKSAQESMKRELADYKLKAHKILQSKEKLITSLKDTSNGGVVSTDSVVITMNAELEQIKQERDLLKEELNQCNGSLEQSRAEMQDVESQLRTELELASEQMSHLEEQISFETKLKEDLMQDNLHLKEELQYYKEETSRQKNLYQSRLSDRDKEIEKLQKQLTMKVMNNSQVELESRLHALTESLIQKQTLVEALSTEKSSLTLQLERLEQQMKEYQSYACRSTTHSISVAEDSNIKSRIPDYLLENPFDGRVTRRVKRAYSTLDSFSVQLGIVLRRYPTARVMVLIYMMLLHLLVLMTLFTYSPETHTKEDK